MNVSATSRHARSLDRAAAARAAIEEAYGCAVSDAEWDEIQTTLVTFFGLLDQWALEDDARPERADFSPLGDGKIDE